MSRVAPGPDLVERYGCGPVALTGVDHALYERHLLFDDVIDMYLDHFQHDRRNP